MADYPLENLLSPVELLPFGRKEGALHRLFEVRLYIDISAGNTQMNDPQLEGVGTRIAHTGGS